MQQAAEGLVAEGLLLGIPLDRRDGGTVLSGVLADGLVMLAEGKLAEGAARLMVLVQYSPEESFAPWAGVLAVEAARKAGDKTAADSYARQITDTYGPRLAQELKMRLG